MTTEFKFRGTVLAKLCETCEGSHDYSGSIWYGIAESYGCIDCGGDGYTLTKAGEEMEAFVKMLSKRYLKG